MIEREASGGAKPTRNSSLLAVVGALIVIGIVTGCGSAKETPSTRASSIVAGANSTVQSPSVAASLTSTLPPPTSTQPTPTPTPTVPAEYKSALDKATQYANVLHLSKQGVYDQLTSEYGEKFTAPAAQYAVDNVQADWNANALAKAKTYQDQLHLSPAAIHDQLTSANGEKFTEAQADYAIQHLNG